MSQGCDPNATDLSGITPVYLAERRNDEKVLQLLTNFSFEQLSL